MDRIIDLDPEDEPDVEADQLALDRAGGTTRRVNPRTLVTKGGAGVFVGQAAVDAGVKSIRGAAAEVLRAGFSKAAARKLYGGSTLARTDDVSGTGYPEPTGRTFVSTSLKDGIRQTGTIRRVKVNMLRADPAPGSVKFKVMRANGASFDLVSESEAVTPVVGDNVFDLLQPMACRAGDRLAIYLRSAAVSGDSAAVGINTSGGTCAYVAGDAGSGAVYTTAAGSTLCLSAEGPPPFMVGTGDSILAGFNGPEYWLTQFHDGPAGNLASTSLNAVSLALGCEYQNWAQGSTTWADGVAKMADIAALNPRAVLAHFGVNDLAADRTWAAVKADMDSIRAALPAGATLFVDEILPWRNGTDAQAATLREWNANYAAWCANNGAVLIQCHDDMGQIRTSTGELDDTKTDFNLDGVHLSWAGVAALAELQADAFLNFHWL